MAYRPGFADFSNTPNVSPDLLRQFGIDPTQTGGVLSGQQGVVNGPLSGNRDWRAQLGQFLDPQVALPIAAQLMGGANLQDSLAGGFAAAGQAIPGMQQRAALNAYLKSKSGFNLTPEEQQMLQTDPELGRAFLAQQLAPKPPTWGVIGKDSSGAEQYGWINASSQTVTPVASPGGGAGHMFPGTSVEATGLSWLVDNGKLTQEQAAQLAASKQVSGADGTIYLATPEGIFGKPPGGGPAVPVGQGPPQDGSTPGNTGGAGAGMIPIGKAKPSEFVVKSKQNYYLANQQLPIIRENFDELTSLGNQAADVSIATRWLTTPGFQRAKQAISTTAASYLYSVSGATANPGETEKLAASVVPFPGESQASIDDKKARVEAMVKGIKIAADGGTIPDEIRAKVEGGGGGGGAKEGDTATGPGGHKIVMKGGKWLDAETGQPIQ